MAHDDTTARDSLLNPEIERRFTYHAPDAAAAAAHARVNELCKALAHELDGLLPPGRETALAMTQLEQCRMWSNAAIACRPR